MGNLPTTAPAHLIYMEYHYGQQHTHKTKGAHPITEAETDV